MYKVDDITVLIATKDRVDEIERAIQSSINQSLKVNIVVLDDSSEINIKEKLEDKFKDKPIKWMRSSAPSGVAGARNKLVEGSEGSIMVFLDDDAYFTDKYSLENIIKKFSTSDEIAGMAFKIILRQNDDGLQIPFNRLKRFLNKNIHNEESDVSYYVGAGHVLLRETFEKVGGYDSELFYGLEELDISSEIIKEDKKIIYFPQVQVIHEPKKSVVDKKNKLKDEAYYSIRNRIWVSYKHLPAMYLVVHLTVWGSFYFLKSLLKFQLGKFFIATFEGFKKLNSKDRKPFNSSALKYLKRNNGRLWY
ncbi:MAG: glycosyltransferase family 2 protein [SAR202 cluster bacterium]|nr:glycosyltransferase family 2 protein [SAR202 cluster bacterium]|tara:strand:+ start:14444 stop:15361 length:918 start_codon:yes stop_codon:yes gene_type:complete